MRALKRWFRRLLRRVFRGRAPDAPARLAEEVRLFRVMYPAATDEEWQVFASQLASAAWQDGFVRGFAWRDVEGAAADRRFELEVQSELRLTDDERLAQVLATGYDPNDPLGGMTPAERAEYYRQFGAVLQGAPAAVVRSRGEG